MKIYRVENDDGRGPYWDNPCVEFNDKLFKALSSHNEDDEKHPTPCYDCFSAPRLGPEIFCGFLSLQQVRDWFTKQERKLLRDDGFKFKAFDIPKKFVWEGRKQCVFLRNSPKCKPLPGVVSEAQIEKG